MSHITNSNRIQRDTARVNELLDLLREQPILSHAEVVKTLAERWDKSTDTVTRVFQYAQRKKLVTKKTMWVVK